MIVRYRTNFDDEERVFIAQYYDAKERKWPLKKRLATRKECRKYIHEARCLWDDIAIDTVFEWNAENEEKEEASDG